MSATSTSGKEKESHSDSLQKRKAAKKDKHSQLVTGSERFSRPVVQGKATSAIEKGKALVSAASKIPGLIFDVVQYSIRELYLPIILFTFLLYFPIL